MEDKKIIELLKKIVDEKLLNGILIDNAIMCIEILTNGGSGEIENIRMMAKNLIRVAGFEQPNSNKFVIDNTKEEIIARSKIIIEEIKYYLNTDDLTPYLRTSLEILLDKFNKEGITNDELNGICSLYESEYRRALTIIDEYIPETSNHKR